MDDCIKKVMIVEDDEHISNVYEMKLEKEGIHTVCVKDGQNATEAIFQEKPDLIILDIMLPGKDGFEVIKEIKQNAEIANIPIIVLSNLGQDPDQARALALGANEYVIKISCSTQEVVAKVKGYLGV